MKYKAFDLFILHTTPTVFDLSRLLSTYGVPNPLEKDPTIRTYTQEHRHILEVVSYETHNKGTSYEYRDTWRIRLILYKNKLLIETIYPPAFPFDTLDAYAEQQERLKDKIIKHFVHIFMAHNYISQQTIN